MTFKKRRNLRILRDYCLGWMIAFMFMAIVRGVGTTELGSVQFELKASLVVCVVFGIFFGSISGYAQILTERAYKRISLQKLLTLRLVYAILFLVIIILVAYVMCRSFFGITISLVDFAFEPGSFAIYFYILSVDILMVILSQVNLMLGEHNLGRLLRGKFYNPREEERIFMFLDLQSSTQLAERLGHIKYSRLIQDCFDDLSVVATNEAEIYQYVGDEVILTWKHRAGLNHQNCLKAFFNFKSQLISRKNHYLDNYGCQPFFKAGINVGIVTVTEVGRYKREIAYHGDTMNTAARIQGKCNEFNQELLISENLKNLIDEKGFSFESIGSIPLKGKEKGVDVYGVSEMSTQ